MLTQLTVRNFGLIDNIALEFGEHLNILTGETGAGKSILIDALRIALGGKIAASQFRDADKPCVIETVFVLHDRPLLQNPTIQEFTQDGEPSLIIQRTFTSDGKNKIKINGLNVTLGQLKDVGNLLVDVHGAHDHQMLLLEESHIRMLDRLVDFGMIFEKYDNQYQDHLALKRKLNALAELAATSARERDLLEHQIKELEQVPLDDNHYQQLAQDRDRINNTEHLRECVHQILQLLEGDETDLAENVRQAFRPMRSLNETDSSTASFMNLLEQLQTTQDELLNTVRTYADGLRFDAETARHINDRYDVYDDIKRKYGPTLAEANNFYAQLKERFTLLSDLENNDGELRKQLAATGAELFKTAKEISKRRKKTAADLKKTIEKELTELGIKNVQFDVRMTSSDFSETGTDRVVFYISPNAGENLKPLAEIVSSGEAARVMLALKKALVKVDPIPVLIFDEIDAQIGGRLGTVTGEKLRDIASARQVILITHLPQIASFADQHFKVTKAVKYGRATTEVQLLDKKARVQELATMMSGEKTSDIAVKHANEMLTKVLR